MSRQAVIRQDFGAGKASEIHAALVRAGMKDTGHDGISSIFSGDPGPWQLIVNESDPDHVFVTISNNIDIVFAANHFFEDVTGSFDEVCGRLESLCQDAGF